MSTHPRATVPARQQQQALLSSKELEAIRCAWRSGLHEPVVGVLLEQVAIRDTAIHTFARQAAAGGTPEQQAAAQVAEEMIDAAAPLHFRIEFDYVAPPSVGVRRAKVTVTYRGESETWGAGLP